MRPILITILAAFALGACVDNVPEPQSNQISTGTSSIDSRITYTISEYVTPYAIDGIMASHKLDTTTVLVETDFADRVRYIGLPDEVAPELGAAMTATCQSAGQDGFNQVVENARLQVRRLTLYFNCG